MGVAGIVVDGEAMLSTLDFDKPMLSTQLLGGPLG
jgi:hypothetical protein